MLYQLSYTPAAVVSLGFLARRVKRRSASYHSSYHTAERSCSVLVPFDASLKAYFVPATPPMRRYLRQCQTSPL